MSENKVVLLGTKGGPRMEKGLSWSTCSVIEVNGHPSVSYTHLTLPPIYSV